MVYISLIFQQNQFLRIDLGKEYNINSVGLQGKPNADVYVETFYLKFSMDNKRWSFYGQQISVPPYKVRN